jgi:hypothetical protein
VEVVTRQPPVTPTATAPILLPNTGTGSGAPPRSFFLLVALAGFGLAVIGLHIWRTGRHSPPSA